MKVRGCKFISVVHRRNGLALKMLLLAIALFLGGCASTHELRAFRTDGCSLFPDGDADDPPRWSACCVTHDFSYWRGGTAQERKNADQALRHCVLERTQRQWLADQMYRGVRIGGTPLLPTWFRWAYGWGYGRGYEPLTAEERQRAETQLEIYRLGQADGACQ